MKNISSKIIVIFISFAPMILSGMDDKEAKAVPSEDVRKVDVATQVVRTVDLTGGDYHEVFRLKFAKMIEDFDTESIFLGPFVFIDMKQAEIATYHLEYLPPRLKNRIIGLNLSGCPNVFVDGQANPISWLSENANKELPSLRHLDISYCKLSDYPKYLQRLYPDIESMQYDYAPHVINHISKIENLTRLNLSGHGLSASDLEPITKLTSLEHLNISGNRIGITSEKQSDEDTITFIKSLSNLKELKHLVITNCHLSDKHIQMIKGTLPNTKVGF